MLYFVSILLVFFSAAIVSFAYLSIDKSDDLEKKAGLEDIREWSEETSLIKTFTPLIKLFKPITDSIPVPEKINKKINGWIVSAGFEAYVTVKDLIGLQFVLSILGFFLANFALDGTKTIAGVAIVGFFLPIFWIHEAAKERRIEILRELPGAVDSIALSVGAGLEFNESISRLLSQKKSSKSPLMMELKIYLQNVRIGMGRSEALNELADRVDTQDMHSFTGILIQADKMGASISDTLMQQAARIRQERFVAAEKAGAVASQKLMLPMMVFVFPLVFAVILVPLFLRFIYG